MKINNVYKLLLLSFTLALQCNFLISQNSAIYWVQFTDKTGTQYTTSQPLQFLSHRAIDRRLKNNCDITEQDFPVNQNYLDSLKKIGFHIIHTSKWFNAANVTFEKDSLIEILKNKTFVKAIEKTRDKVEIKSAKENLKLSFELNTPDSSYYKYGYLQILIDNGIFLQKNGFKGKGVQIAVIDAGFKDAGSYVSLSNLRTENRILGTKDFVYPTQDLYSAHFHGAAVLSMMAGDYPGLFSGTAPEASYWLLRSEDTNSEYPVEEDNWVAAAEFADSAGVDVINTSLGYTQFDNPTYNHTYQDLDGNTTRVAIAANIASSKGIVVVVSAGNDGNGAWHYISTPADARNILTIGAVDGNKKHAYFSSYGPSADNRVKPDISSMGLKTFAEINPNNIGEISGTSCSAPVTSGLVACLIQAFPYATNKEIIDAIKISSSQYLNPDSAFGFGIPDFFKAYLLLSKEKKTEDNIVETYPNPCTDYLTIFKTKNIQETIRIECVDETGHSIFTASIEGRFLTIPMRDYNLKSGIYFLKISYKNKTQVKRFFKINPSE